MTSTLSQSILVFQRQARAGLADPGPFFALPMLPPLLMVVVFTAVFDSLADLEDFATTGFTSNDFDSFVLPGVTVLVALLGAGATSSSLAFDLRSGYAERLHLSGMSVGPALGGRLGFEIVRLIPAIVVVILVGLLLGGSADNGVAGVLVLTGLIALLGAAYSGIFYIAAIASQDPQTPFTLQPLGLPLAFLSSALVPIAVMPTWSETISRFNPVSVIVDAGRHAMIGDLWSSELAISIAVLTAWIVLTQFAATGMLRRSVVEA